jgi:indolepyruvate ferredoxin oxidoreductase
MAAHVEGKGVTVLDMTGLAQKGGAVMSHVRIAQTQDRLHSTRIATGEACLLLGCDMVVAVSDDALSKTAPGMTRAIVNTAQAITGEFLRNPDRAFPAGAMEQAVADAVGADAATFIDASRLASRLMGHSIATNIFMLGYAFQLGLIPLSSAALLRAIELNGSTVDENRRAFSWGRRAALDPAGVEAMVAAGEPVVPDRKPSSSFDELVSRRRDYLTSYQDAAYARRYTDLVERVGAKLGAKGAALTEAVARNYFKLLAYKDEFEVARLFCEPAFREALESRFEGDYRLDFHITLPWSQGARPGDEPKKIRFGPWLMPAMKFLARLKFLRGTPLNPFGRIAERKQERELIAEYERGVTLLLEKFDPARLDAAVAIASIPDGIRGYGPVKVRSIAQAEARRKELMASFERGNAVTERPA